MAQAQGAGGGQAAPGGNRQRGQGGNFDPAQMQQRMMERYKERLDITSDDDWKAISPLIEKVTTARREQMMSSFGGFGGRRGGGPGGGGPGGGGPGGGQGPELTGAIADLQKAIDGNASSSELKAVMAKLSTERKAKEAALKDAQDKLRGVLSVKQEAKLVLEGLLPPQ